MADADQMALKNWTRRPLFSPTQMLTAEQLNLMMDDQRAQTEKLMRGLHGNGVIFGLAVDRDEVAARLRVSCGMALDRHGRLLHWSGGPLNEDDISPIPKCEGTFTLAIHHARREVPGGGCGPCSDRPQWIEEGVVYTLIPGGGTIDRDCVRPRDGACIGLDEYVCLRNGSGDGELAAAADLEWACGEAEKPIRWRCSDIFYDAGAGIPIALVEVRNLCDPGCPPIWGFGEVREPCAARPWVYRTPLLYELIKGCQNDLARVESVRWGPVWSGADGWPDNVPWAYFTEALQQGPEIAFTKPVETDTLHPGSVFLTAILWEKAADYMLTRRIPAVLQALDAHDGYATRFRLQVNSDWIQSELGSRSELKSGGRVELTIRGQMIRDRCDNMLDALPLGYEPSTPRHSRPGGDFVTLLRFAVAPAEPAPEPDPEQQASLSDQDF